MAKITKKDIVKEISSMLEPEGRPKLAQLLDLLTAQRQGYMPPMVGGQVPPQEEATIGNIAETIAQPEKPLNEKYPFVRRR